MTREAAVAVMIGVAVLILLAMLWGWRRRARRDSGLSAPLGEAPAGAVTLASAGGLYVATTAHGAPLERFAIRPLAFRSRVTVTVTTAGVALDLPGAPRVFIAAERLRGTGRATWTIDRVVEPGGLPFITWRVTDPAVTDEVVVDSYFRVQDGNAAALLAAITGLVPTPIESSTEATPTGTES